MNTEQTLTSCLIRLRGSLDPEPAALFPELSITDEADGNSLLAGNLPDRSALLGILFRIHNLNLKILSEETGGSETLSEQR